MPQHVPTQMGMEKARTQIHLVFLHEHITWRMAAKIFNLRAGETVLLWQGHPQGDCMAFKDVGNASEIKAYDVNHEEAYFLEQRH